MHWIIFHIKHTAAYLCSITHLAVWTMRKDFHVILFPYLQNCNHVQILEHGMGVASCPFERVWLPQEW